MASAPEAPHLYKLTLPEYVPGEEDPVYNYSDEVTPPGTLTPELSLLLYIFGAERGSRWFTKIWGLLGQSP